MWCNRVVIMLESGGKVMGMAPGHLLNGEFELHLHFTPPVWTIFFKHIPPHCQNSLDRHMVESFYMHICRCWKVVVHAHNHRGSWRAQVGGLHTQVQSLLHIYRLAPDAKWHKWSGVSPSTTPLPCAQCRWRQKFTSISCFKWEMCSLINYQLWISPAFYLSFLYLFFEAIKMV